MDRKLPYVASFLLLAVAVILGACKQPSSPTSRSDDNDDRNYTYTVTFDKNHADADAKGWSEAGPATMTIASPATTLDSLPVSPKRQNWNFTGWNTARNGSGTPFVATTAVTANITVYAQWKEIALSGSFAVRLSISGNATGDSVTHAPLSGKAGDTVTISYTVVHSKANNLLDFSGVSSAIAPVTAPGSGKREYVIKEADAVNGTITINAVFLHTDLELDPLVFAGDSDENKTYGDAPFTKGFADRGKSGGAISYSAVNHNVATVNDSTGEVTIHGAGSSVITATKASDGIYAGATATYTLNVAKKQLTIGNPTVTATKTYNGNTTAVVTAGTLVGIVGSDVVDVSAAAAYNSVNVLEANLITVAYTITGGPASHYIKPADYTIAGTITKATGIDVAAPPSMVSGTSTSVTLNKVILIDNATAQTVEYARATAASPEPTTGWQDNTVFNSLAANTEYYFFARSKATDNYRAGTAKASAAIVTAKTTLTVALKTSGNGPGDSVTLSRTTGVAGDAVTINYTVASSGSANNRLDFSGVNSAISPVTASGSGTRSYAINEADATNGTITINAAFNHTNQTVDTIAFTGTQENKIYGDTPFTKALTTAGSGSGTVSYSSGDTAVATVTNSGLVTILKNGTSVITATKASDGTYTGATAAYTLTVAQKQLTIGNPTNTSKQYDRTTAAPVTAGALTGKVGSDAVTVTVDTATYNSANVAEANQITVVYAMSGADSGKYLKPGNSTVAGTITRATGIEIAANPTVASKTQTSVTLNAATLTGGSTYQTVEYARATVASPVPTTGWQDNTAFNSLTANTRYYFFARAKENANYSAGTAKASAEIWTEKTTLTVALKTSGNVTGDNVALSHTTGVAGDAVTINYTVANSHTAKNELAFSGVSSAISPVTASGSGTRTYTINEADAVSGTVTINAAFTHIDLKPNAIAFTGTEENKTYGDAVFTKALTTTGSGTGTTTWSSGTTAVATVNGSNGQVTIVGAGTSVITATKASDGEYAGATAAYTLKVAQKQLTIGNPTVTTTRVYNGSTVAEVTAGTLAGRVGSDTVTVTAAANYNSADVGTGKTITVVYTMSGADSGKYIKPVDYTTTGAITKATGIDVSANPTMASNTSTRITLNAATLAGNSTAQTVEYARGSAATPVPATWQDGRDFTGLTADTQYYFFARSKENANYSAGTAKNAPFRTLTAGTPSVPPTIVDFEKDNTGKTYTVTGGNGNASAEVIADPLNSVQKSLKINVTGYNRAAIIPINLPYALQNYQTFSFRINIQSGTDLSNNQVLVYAAGNTSAFVNYGFGNTANNPNNYPQFEANLIGQTESIDFSSTQYKNTWTTFTVTLAPGASTSNLKGDIYIAIGIHSGNATYLVDDITFMIKDGFEPPTPKPAPQPPSTGAVASGNYRNLFSELGKSPTEITAKVNTTWNRLFGSDENYKVYYEVAGDMAYIYDSGNDDVRSEGMSYGMMMAVQMNKQTEFNKLWRWAKTNMYNETNQKNCRGYFAWQCGTNGNKKDTGCAPDGEFYFATALLFAHARWGSGSGILDYRKHAMQLLYDMIHRTSPPDNYGEPAMFRDTDYNGAGKYMTVFQPQGSAGQFTDPSYHLPAFYEVWAIELEKDANAGNLHGIWDNAAAMKTDAAFYRNAVTASRGLFKNAVNATTGLGPDYSHFTGAAYGSDAHSHFEYDAFRTVMNAAMDYSWFAVDSWQKTYADTLQSFFHSKGVNSYTALWTLTGTSRGGDHSPGLIACNAVASLAATHQRAWDFLDDFWEISMTPGRYRYYDGCLYMLGLLHVTGNFKAYLSSGTYTPNPGISPTSATFDKRSTLQQDIVVSMTLNGNTLSNIRNGATTLTSGATANYTVSGSTVTIRKEYLATLANGAVTLTFNFSGGSASTLSITITDTTPSAVISPTSATFDKRSDLRADIPVTMTLNGYNFTRVQNGTTNLTSDTDYTVSGTTVTLKTSYLALQPNGTTTLTFVFSGGSNKDIAITIRETAAGATPGGGTKIDFSTNPSVTLAYVGSNVSASVTGGALRVVSSGSYNGAGVILTLDLGSQNLNSFTGIKLVYRGVTGDTGSKDFIVEVPTTAGGTLGNLGSNTRLITQRVSGTTTETYNKINFTGTVPSRTGELKIAVGLYNTGAVTYDIISIELVP